MLPQTGERQVAETLDGIKPNHRNRYQFAIDMIKRDIEKDDPVIIDCACGVGYGTLMLADAFENGHAHGFDIEPKAVEVARRAYGISNNSFAAVDLGNPEQWTNAVADITADVIVSIETIEHVEHASALIHRYAETAPYLVASVPNEQIVPFNKASHPFHFRHYTRQEFEQLLNDHGYEVLAWATQYDKIPGIVYEDADDGMGFIVSAKLKV